MAPLIFVSHSSQDSQTAEAIVRLLRLAFNLAPADIRCTSVDGYRLPAGSDTDAQLRNEVLGAQVLIGILSPQGMSSAYVLFELGARWGAQKPLVPLLAPGIGPEILKGPVSGLNALRSDSEPQLHQLISDLASYLGRPANSPASYAAELKAIASAPASPSYRVEQPEDKTQPELTEDQLAVIRAFAQADRPYIYKTELESVLGWNRVKVEHHIDVLRDLGYLDFVLLEYGVGYGLDSKGRAAAVRAGFADD